MRTRNISGLGSGWDAKCAVCGSEFRAISVKQNVCSAQCRFDLYKGDSGDGCWEWQGPVNNQGYGVLFLNQNRENGRRMVKPAHRYSYEKYVGDIPEGMCLMHSCDNRSCVNPKHLSVGTWADNNRDRSIKGRSGKKHYSEEDKQHYSEVFRGEGNPCAKLTEEGARHIKYFRDMPVKELMAKYGISKTTVGHIRSGRAWKHI